MSAPIGNKNATGNKGGGRAGYEFEKRQLDLMRKIVSKDLKMVERFYDGKTRASDLKMLVALQGRVGKYLDKLHASKSGFKLEQKRPLLIKYIKEELQTKSKLNKNK